MNDDGTRRPAPMPSDDEISRVWNASASSWDASVTLGVWHADLLLAVGRIRREATPALMGAALAKRIAARMIDGRIVKDMPPTGG